MITTANTFASRLAMLLLIGMATMSLNSCGGGAKGDGFQNQLTNYLKKDLPKVSLSSNKYAAYFDFTGVLTAYSDSNTAQTFNGLTQKITSQGDKFDNYKLSDSKIEPLSGEFSPAQQFAILHDTTDKAAFFAPIEKTLGKIADEGRPAVLVTDFEEYTPEGIVYKQAYATPYFEKWLSRGGDITFYVTNYTEGSVPKHLYYVVFDYNQHNLLKMVEESMQGKPKNYQRFTLSANAYPMGTAYPNANAGGTYHDASGEDIIFGSVEDGKLPDCHFMVDSLRAESYVFANNWTDSYNNAKEQTRANDPSNPAFTHVFDKLFIDLSHSDSYKLKKMTVRVSDVQADFDKYTAYFTAINNKPKVERENGETYVDFSNAKDGEQYYDDNGKLLPDYDYAKAPGKIGEVKDMLVFDDKLFNSSYAKNPARTELGITFSPNFNGTLSPNIADPSDLLRVDIVIADAEICPQSRINELFYWPGNDCLSSAIMNVLQDLKPIGKPVYSYFVRTL